MLTSETLDCAEHDAPDTIENPGLVFERGYFTILQKYHELLRNVLLMGRHNIEDQIQSLGETLQVQLRAIDTLLQSMNGDRNIRYTLKRHQEEYGRMLHAILSDFLPNRDPQTL